MGCPSDFAIRSAMTRPNTSRELPAAIGTIIVMLEKGPDWTAIDVVDGLLHDTRVPSKPTLLGDYDSEEPSMQPITHRNQHMYASRSRFLTDGTLPFFQCRSWPTAEQEAISPAMGLKAAVDIGARLRARRR
jgi:hypothetical protein